MVRKDVSSFSVKQFMQMIYSATEKIDTMRAMPGSLLEVSSCLQLSILNTKHAAKFLTLLV